VDVFLANSVGTGGVGLLLVSFSLFSVCEFSLACLRLVAIFSANSGMQSDPWKDVLLKRSEHY